MKVVIDDVVHTKIEEFYTIAMALHPTLDVRTVDAKKTRLYVAVRRIGIFPEHFPVARVKKDWIKKGYKEMICEDFHFAFDYVLSDKGEIIVYVFDVVHSKLNH